MSNNNFNASLNAIAMKIGEVLAKKKEVSKDDYRSYLDYRNFVYEVFSRIHAYFDKIEAVCHLEYEPEWMKFSYWRKYTDNGRTMVFDGDLGEAFREELIRRHRENVRNIMTMTAASEDRAEALSWKTFVIPICKHVGRETDLKELENMAKEKFGN